MKYAKALSVAISSQNAYEEFCPSFLLSLNYNNNSNNYYYYY